MVRYSTIILLYLERELDMKFNFAVGNRKIDYEFNTFWGAIKIWIDGNQVSNGFIMAGGKKKSTFVVDGKEISIIIDQPIFFAIIRKTTFKVYIDNNLYKVFDKKGILIKPKD